MLQLSKEGQPGGGGEGWMKNTYRCLYKALAGCSSFEIIGRDEVSIVP